MSQIIFNSDYGDIRVPSCTICQSAKEWIRWIPETNKKYAVTSNGRIVSYTRKKPFVMSTDGKHEYERARLGQNVNCVVVHRIVASVFPDMLLKWSGVEIDWNKYEIDHFDKNKKHNCTSNLRVELKGSQVKLNYLKGERELKVAYQDIDVIKQLRLQGIPVREIAERFGISVGRIYQLTKPS